MVSTVRSRPSHYELLGLSPAANGVEIEKAFAKEVLRPRPFGTLADVTVAYETLRDPAKRKAYDESLRPAPKVTPALSLVGRLEGTSFASVAPAKSWNRPTTSPSPSATSLPTPAAAPDPRPDRKTFSPPGEPLLQPIAREIPRAAPRPVQTRQAQTVQKPWLERQAATALVDKSKEASIDWKFPIVAMVPLVLAIGLGAWAGWESGNDGEQAPVEEAAAMLKPPRAADDMLSATPVDPAPAVTETQPEMSAARTLPRRARVANSRLPAKPVEQQTEMATSDQSDVDNVAAEAAVTESPSVETTAAAMPLPGSVIARTIRRIGYSCGQVASTTPLETPGAFKVTCTSGQSYRAAPVNGRYRFKKY